MTIIAWIIVPASIITLVAVFWMLKGPSSATVNLDQLRSQLRPMDVEAFRNLIDSREREYLRDRLTLSDFRRIHRERMLAATDYVWCAAHNAGVLIRLGEAAKNVSDPSLAETASTLQQNAFRLRLQAFQAIPRLYLSMIVSDWDLAPQELADRCDRLTRQAIILGSLQAPSHGI
jgi:hypothetical protein